MPKPDPSFTIPHCLLSIPSETRLDFKKGKSKLIGERDFAVRNVLVTLTLTDRRRYYIELCINDAK